jgi:hypothetical protein
MVFPIIPVLSAVVGVAGTVANINAQNRQAAQQNAAISAQISSNKRSEEIRQAGARFQEAIIKQQHRLEGTARRVAFHQQQQQLQEMAIQEAIAAENEMTGRNLATENLAVQTGDAQRQLAAGIARTDQDARYAGTDARRQIGQSMTQVAGQNADLLSQMVQAKRERQNASSQLSAMGADTRINSRDLERAVLDSQQRGYSATMAHVDSIADIQRAAALEAENARISAGLQHTQLGSYLESQRRVTVLGNQARAAESVAFSRQTQLAQQQNRINNRIATRQSAMDRLLQQAGLVTGYEAAAAQAAAQRAQLESQKVSGVGFMQAAAQMLSASTPLMNLLDTNRGTQSLYSPTFGTPSNAGITQFPPGYQPGGLITQPPPMQFGQPLPGRISTFPPGYTPGSQITQPPPIQFGQPISSPSSSRLSVYQQQYNAR